MKITALPPDFQFRTVSLLSLKDLSSLAQCCRRLKVICLHDAVFHVKLTKIGFHNSSGHLAECWMRLFPDLIPPERVSYRLFAKTFHTPSRVPTPIRMDKPSSPPVGAPCKHMFNLFYNYLWPLFSDFVHGPREGRDYKVLEMDCEKQAIHLTVLYHFSKLLDTSIASALGARLCLFQTEMLSAFDSTKDDESLKVIAHTMYYLDGAQSCIDQFIYKSPIFYERHDFDHPQLAEFITNVSKELVIQVPRIATIFLNPIKFQYRFVEKVFQECLFDFLTKLLKIAKEKNFEVFLNSLTICFENCSDLIAKMKGVLDTNRVEALLQEALMPFKTEYISQELQYCSTKASEMAQKHLNFENYKPIKTPWPGKINKKEVIECIKTNFSIFNPDAQSYAELDLLLNIQLVNDLIEHNLHSLKRSIVMMKTSGKMTFCAESIYVELLGIISRSHMQPCFNTARQRISDFSSTPDYIIPLPNYFLMIETVDNILNNVEKYFAEYISRYVNPNNFLAESIKARKTFGKEMDDCVASGLDLAIMGLCLNAESILKNAIYSKESECTEACYLTIDYFQRHFNLIKTKFETQTVHAFISEVCTRFYHLVCKHIRIQKITKDAAKHIMIDVSFIHKWVESLKLEEVAKMYQALNSLMLIYIIDCPQLKSLLREQSIIFGVDEIHEFAKARSDYNKIRRQIRDAECTIS